MLSSERTGVRDLVEQLEWRYLANRDDNIFFALLTDFPDAQREDLARRSAAADVGPIGNRTAQRAVLPQPSHDDSTFCTGRGNGIRQEGAWMAEERKRGKLAALNRLVRPATARRSASRSAISTQLSSVRYVITLDTDTRLPRDSGRELAGCMAHPLNRPQIDPPHAPGGQGAMPSCSRALAFRSPKPTAAPSAACWPAIPGSIPIPGRRATSYQDVFGQGSFIGKGIYDVRAFSAALEGRFPDNRVLSHDLIEGCYARSGLVNDVELFEGLPSRFLADMSRRHRWIRGDWQIAAWLWSRVPTARGKARQSAGRVVAVEDLRQSAPQPRAAVSPGLSPCRLDAGSRSWPAIGPRWPCCWRAARRWQVACPLSSASPRRNPGCCTSRTRGPGS